MAAEQPQAPARPSAAAAVAFAGLAPGAPVSGLARVVDAASALTRTGEPFLRLRLADPAGRVLAARRFACPDPPPPPGCVVRIAGVADAFNGALSLRLTACAPAAGVAADAFWPRTPATRAVGAADLAALVAGIPDPALRALVERCLPPAARARFLAAPASVARHGAAVGGLAAHSVRVARLALAFADVLVPQAERGVLVAAALCHDLGKLDANRDEPGAGVTDAGRLVGHVVLGILRVARAADGVPDLSPERAVAVLHAVAAAHGRLEWGAPVVPATLEALLVHLADLAEARVESALAATEAANPGSDWTAYLPAFGTALRVAGAAR
jgi:3'-5' exoribonuclease